MMTNYRKILERVYFLHFEILLFRYLFSDSFTRRHALDSTETHHLKTYIRRRKNSIVQHVIGYNYDDDSTAGGLYTRVGIGSKLNKKNLSDYTSHLNGSF
jgi:hypothetical protein